MGAIAVRSIIFAPFFKFPSKTMVEAGDFNIYPCFEKVFDCRTTKESVQRKEAMLLEIPQASELTWI
jgi:hypothetical protein